MNLYDFPPLAALVSAASWAVTQLADLLAPLAGPAGAGLAVVLLTVLVRAALVPVGWSQVRAEITRRRLAPQVAELRRRHASRPDDLRRELAALYASENASPAAGCLPLLLQAPVLMAVYGLFALPVVGGAPNELLAHTFLGVELGSRLTAELTLGTLTPSSAALHLAVMGVIGVVAHVTRRRYAPPSTGGATDGPSAVPGLAGLTTALGFLPFVTVAVAAFVPFAAALYLMTTTAWSLAERVVLRRVLNADGAEPGGRPAPA